ncbi:MAG: LysR family transcriptional regulator [Pseudomonadota bacterium]
MPHLLTGIASRHDNAMKPINPGMLECIVAIAEEGGVQRAAARLGLTQSAVSQRLSGLEAHVGMVLFVRHRPTRLTPAGEALLRHARQVQILSEQFLRELRGIAPEAQEQHETIAIAASLDDAAGWAWPAFDRLMGMGVDLSIVPAGNALAMELLGKGDVQGCIAFAPKAVRSCKTVRLGAVDFIAVATPGHALALRAGATPLHAARLLVACREDLAAADLAAAIPGLDPAAPHCCVLPSPDIRHRTLLAGAGVGIVPAASVAQPLACGDLVNAYPAFVLRREVYWSRWNIASTLLDLLDQELQRAFPVQHDDLGLADLALGDLREDAAVHA